MTPLLAINVRSFIVIIELGDLAINVALVPQGKFMADHLASASSDDP